MCPKLNVGTDFKCISYYYTLTATKLSTDLSYKLSAAKLKSMSPY